MHVPGSGIPRVPSQNESLPGSNAPSVIHAARQNSDPAARAKAQMALSFLDGPASLIDSLTELTEVANELVEKYLAGVSGEAMSSEAVIEKSVLKVAGLRDAIFVGHIKTDLDSIAGAIGAAALFDGTPAAAQRELNGEIQFALDFAKLKAPKFFDDIPGASKRCPITDGFCKVCLVDHNELKQMTPSLREDPRRADRIVGLIDHHAVSEGFISKRALLVDVRPWGSMSSIVTHMYLRANIYMPKQIARIMLCAILSDTLNLQSVTTTKADRIMVAILARLGDVGDFTAIGELAKAQFKAKTQWIVELGAYEMVRGDQKDFTAGHWKFGIAVLEVTTPAPVLAVMTDLLLELRVLKKEKGGGIRKNQLDFVFLFVVDVTNQCSQLLICGGRELLLAKLAFPSGTTSNPLKGNDYDNFQPPGETISKDDVVMDVGGLVSRKSQFAPAIFNALMSDSFKCHKQPNGTVADGDEQEDEGIDTNVQVDRVKQTVVGRNYAAIQENLVGSPKDGDGQTGRSSFS